MVIATAALCMAITIFHEARSEPIMGQYAVALVVLNRAGKDRQLVCRAAFEKRQFSWTNAGVKKTKAGWKIDPYLEPKDVYAWWLARRIANTTLSGKMIDFTGGATFYHTTKVHPPWRLAMVRTKKIGNHLFYTLPA